MFLLTDTKTLSILLFIETKKRVLNKKLKITLFFINWEE